MGMAKYRSLNVLNNLQFKEIERERERGVQCIQFHRHLHFKNY